MSRSTIVLATALALLPAVRHASARPQDDGGPMQAFTGSLPLDEGEHAVEGLGRSVTISRDGRGLPIIRASDRDDAFLALGFVHAQERFAQMDMLRRHAAGELAALAGPSLAAADAAMRRHGFRGVAAAVVARLDARDRGALAAYTRGVNSGLAALGSPPPEYVVLGASPAAWLDEDAVLVMLAMSDMLQVSERFERSLGTARDLLPPALVDFLYPETSRYDAPMLPEADGGSGYEPVPVPGPDVIDLRGGAPAPADSVDHTGPPPGSNSWAVAGARTAHGGAIVANDPHLALRVPGTWYRATLEWPGTRAGGATLPGVPGIVIGSTERIAWGLTNTTGDFQDVIIVDVDPADPGRYRVPGGWERFGTRIETIHVRGGETRRLELRTTRWGAVGPDDHRGRPTVLRWTAHDADMVNLALLDFAEATGVEDALAIAARWYGPSQNVVIADAEGRIGWTVSGYVPRRVGFDGSSPASWASGGLGWNGSADRPLILDPPSGVLFTANNRTVPLERARPLGGMWASGMRATRIRQRLEGPAAFDEQSLLDIQLDTRLIGHDACRDLILAVTAPDDPDALIRRAHEAAAAWDGRADVESIGLGLLDGVKQRLASTVLGGLVAAARRDAPAFRYRWMLSDEPLQRILEERPAHLLPAAHDSWDALLRAVVRETAARLEGSAEGGVMSPWGALHRFGVEHPLSSRAPAFAGMLDMRAAPMAGHRDAVRVMMPGFGASMRMVVSPGRTGAGILHMPGGQSAHPLSPHYRDGHADWVAGRATPFDPGAEERVLRLVPEG